MHSLLPLHGFYVTELIVFFFVDKRSARLSQFVIHRGVIISIIQAVFSAIFFWVAISIYNVVVLSTCTATSGSHFCRQTTSHLC